MTTAPPASPVRSAPPWTEYWKSDSVWKDSPLWDVNAGLFVDRLRKTVGIGPDDKILDVGCGPGYVAARMAPLVGEVVAADIADHYLAQCARLCAPFSNVATRKLGTPSTDLGRCGTGFSLVICVSVIQYYASAAEVRDLIGSAGRVLRPGGRLLIADIPRRRGPAGFAWDAACSLGRGVRLGYARTLLRMAGERFRGASASEYRAFAAAHPELEFTPAEVRALAAGTGTRARVLREAFSVYANRPSLLVEYD